MTTDQGASLLTKMDTLTQQVHASGQYVAGVAGLLLVNVVALLAALLIVVASRPFWRK